MTGAGLGVANISAADIPFGGPPKAESTKADTWPSTLGDAAYHGVIGDIVKALAPQTEADPAAILAHLYAMFGNIIGRAAHFCVGADTHHLNLFVAVVGQTARGRKGMSRGEAHRVFEAVDPEWAGTGNNIISGLSSGEGLIWAVRDPIEKKQAVKENGRVVDYQTVIEDHGVSDKRLMVIEPELASVLKVMSREGNTLSAVIRQAWDGHKLNIKTKNSPAVSTNPHIAIAGHITSPELRRYLTATETANGFANRFLWFCARRSKSLPDGGRPVNIEPYVARLREAVEQVKDRPIEIRRDPDASRLWHRVYAHLGAEIPGLLGAMTSRAEAQVMRLACLYAVADMSYVVRLPHLRAALEVWRYCFQSVRCIFGDRLGDPMADDILEDLRRAYPASRTRTEITHGLFGRNRPAADVSRAFDVLTSLDLARCETDPSGDGRPVERWSWTAKDLVGYDINDIDDKSPDDDGGFVVNVVNVVAPEPVSADGGSPAAPADDLPSVRDVGEL